MTDEIEPGSKKEEVLDGPDKELTPDELTELAYKKKLEELRKRDPFVYR
tara:strand:- start:2416 stop:2562 length:147 start_codon:yes stop_codon:yes gene_type:complete